MNKNNYKETKYNKPLILQRADPYVYKSQDGTYYFTASVPEFTIRIISTCGILSQINSAISTSRSVAQPKLNPFSQARTTASRITG